MATGGREGGRRRNKGGDRERERGEIERGDTEEGYRGYRALVLITYLSLHW
jgi:hypothetical protein